MVDLGGGPLTDFIPYPIPFAENQGAINVSCGNLKHRIDNASVFPCTCFYKLFLHLFLLISDYYYYSI